MAKLIWLIAGAAFAASMAPAQEGPEQILQRAVKLHQSGDPEKAIPLYRQFLQVQPQAAQIRSNLGAALPSTGRYDEAITEYRQALKSLPGDPSIRLNLSLSLYKSGQISEASKELASLHISQPNNRQVTQLLADRKSTRLNSSHLVISYAVFCLKKKKKKQNKGNVSIRPREVARNQ